MFAPDPSVAMKLQHFVSHAHDGAAADDPAAAAQEAATTFNLRLAAIFVVLLAGLLGAMPPLIGSWLRGSPNSTTARLIRACSGGIILSLALIHIIPESLEQLEGAAGPLPLGGIMVMVGLLAMLLLEYVATYISIQAIRQSHSRGSPPPYLAQKQSHAGDNLLPISGHQPAVGYVGQQAQAAGGAATYAALAAPESPVHAHDAHESCNKLCKTQAKAPAAAAGAGGGAGVHGAVCKGHVHGCGHEHGHEQHDSHAVDMVPSLAHSHGCRQAPACHSTAVKQQVAALIMELGCVFHSVVLGLALGVMTNAPHMVVTLMVVLAVHQAVEGLALGSVLAAVQGMAQQKKYTLAVIYALTLPVGIAAGLLASNSYDPEAPIALRVQGVANGVSGGLLLYVSLFSLLAAELNQHDLLHRPGLAAGLMLAVVFGAGVMCVLGMWA